LKLDKNNHLIRGIGLDNKVITKAGTGVAGIKNGVRLSAQFSNPSGLATDQTGIIYVADTGNSVIRKIAIDGTVSTLAGTGSPSFGDGLGTETGFNQPMGLAIDSSGKLLYVADTGNNLIRLINMTDGNARVSTVSGKIGPPPESLVFLLSLIKESRLFQNP
jgi:DNA-binding beta-propeller fold protein YncE